MAHKDAFPENAAPKLQYKKPVTISALSQLGFCQASFRLMLERKHVVTQKMADGHKQHMVLEEACEPVPKEDALEKIKRGEQFVMREVPVFDAFNRTVGRIDEIEFTGGRDGKNSATIFDDKFSRSIDLRESHKIQLSAYTLALENDADYGCGAEVVAAVLRVRAMNNDVVREFRIGRDALDAWGENVPALLRDARKIAQGQQAAPKWFDIAGCCWRDVPVAQCEWCRNKAVCGAKNLTG